MITNKKQIKLGILGGGQLGRMLIREAMRYPIEVHVLDPDPEAPCNKLADFFVCGSFSDYQTVLDFGRNVDVLTIEIEHVNVEALYHLQENGVGVFPQAHVIEMVQDKGLQKQFYHDHNIPTSPFCFIENPKELEQLDENWFPSFLKLRKMGYDGKGVISLKHKADITKAFDAPSILEKAVEIVTELSVIVAVGQDGMIKSFPLVDMEFNAEANLVEYLFVPSRLDAAIIKEAVSIAESVAQKCGIIGILAVEMFLDKEGKILVNEIAPRAHNSGHHTFEACITSQFEQLLRAVCGYPLGDTALRSPAVMVNLLGEPGFSGSAAYEGMDEILKLEGVYLHLYGKKISKPFRKMGHATILASTLEDAIEKAKFVKQHFKIISQ
jgi:5-(carboxyamino)imidazole ribonucleotide synthase